MSPYHANMADMVRHFSLSDERTRILLGLLDYREALRKAGFIAGFQWIDGSFVENSESTRGRAPNDIDVVTFAKRPLPQLSGDEWVKFINNNPNIFNPRIVKSTFHCDAYFVDLDKTSRLLVDDTRYWFGLFSHQRDSFLWKGMLRIDLASDDQEARNLIQGESHVKEN
jgi:hypothetical protein